MFCPYGSTMFITVNLAALKLQPKKFMKRFVMKRANGFNAIIVLLTLLFSSGNLFAQKPDMHCSWSYSTKQINDSEFDLIFTATIDKHWHLYSQVEVKDGPLPTAFLF